MLDNGAFTIWRKGIDIRWSEYYAWADRWLDCPTTWAIIPDVIDAGPEAQDALIAQWPWGRNQSAPVWHTDEPINRLQRLCDFWPRVCIGSSAQHPVGMPAWRRVMDETFNAIARAQYPHPVPSWAYGCSRFALTTHSRQSIARTSHATTTDHRTAIERHG